jgi:hypothetical protein
MRQRIVLLEAVGIAASVLLDATVSLLYLQRH